MRVLVLGGNGQVGKEVIRLSTMYPTVEVTGYGKDDLDIRSISSITSAIADINPHWIINCSAYTNVDLAETKKELAMDVNYRGVEKLGTICRKMGIPIIHFSTDYVFDGTGDTPYTELDPTNPLNNYGKTKLMGEEVLSKQCPNHIILRTSWVNSHYTGNFVNTMLNLFKAKDKISIIEDQIGSPTSASDLATLVLDMVSTNFCRWGTYNYASEANISWKTFADGIKTCSSEFEDSKCTVTSTTTASYGSKTARPMFSTLDCAKIKTTTLKTLKFDWKASLLESMRLRYTK